MCEINNLLGMLLGGDVAPSLSKLLAEALEFFLAPTLVLVDIVRATVGGCLLPFRLLGLQFLAGLVMTGPEEIIVRSHGPLGFLP